MHKKSWSITRVRSTIYPMRQRRTSGLKSVDASVVTSEELFHTHVFLYTSVTHLIKMADNPIAATAGATAGAKVDPTPMRVWILLRLCELNETSIK